MILSKKSKKLIIVDYDCGNLKSISNAFESLGVKSIVTNKIDFILKASHIVLPGVGAFDKAISNLKKLKLIEAIKIANQNNIPILGICLGMQLLFDSSLENQFTKGLGIIKGKIVKIKSEKLIKIPVVGWNKISINSNKKKILKKITNKSYFYFIHSYQADVKYKKNLISSYLQNNQKIPAIVSNNKNTIGCQFHPEKSGKIGLQFLKNFLAI